MTENNITKNLNLLKGVENAYFDYTLYLNNNWDKIDEKIGLLLDRDGNVYVGEVASTTNEYDFIVAAIELAKTKRKSVFFPKRIYNLSKLLSLVELDVDLIFEEGAVIQGNIDISNTSNIGLTNVTINGDLKLSSIENCKFINMKVNGKTTITSVIDKNSNSNYFVNNTFNGLSGDRGLELSYFDLNANGESTDIRSNISNNTFINCHAIGTSYGIYAKVPDNILFANITNNMFLNCSSKSSTTINSNGISIYLGKRVKNFHFIEQNAVGYYSIDVEKSEGSHILTGGNLNGLINGFEKFSTYKPSTSSAVGYEKIGNNINNMRKMKVFNGEVPKWNKYNVNVENDTTQYDTTGTNCLKITSPNNASFPTLERTFTANEHLNQTINVIVRVKATSTNNLANPAIILTNGIGNNTVTETIKADDKWKIVTLRMQNTSNRDVIVKLSPNNSYSNSINTLYIDWIIVSLGDFAQLSSIPAEEHHQNNLEHFGDFKVKGDLLLDNKLSLMKRSTSFNSEPIIKLGNEIISAPYNTDFRSFEIKVEDINNEQVLKIYSTDAHQDVEGYSEGLKEELLTLTKHSILYRGTDLLNNNNHVKAGTLRPNNPIVGSMFYDINLKQPIWFDGTYWRDANKNLV